MVETRAAALRRKQALEDAVRAAEQHAERAPRVTESPVPQSPPRPRRFPPHYMNRDKFDKISRWCDEIPDERQEVPAQRGEEHPPPSQNLDRLPSSMPPGDAAVSTSSTSIYATSQTTSEEAHDDVGENNGRIRWTYLSAVIAKFEAMERNAAVQPLDIETLRALGMEVLQAAAVDAIVGYTEGHKRQAVLFMNKITGGGDMDIDA